MAIERELSGIYSRQYYELLLVENDCIRLFGKAPPQLIQSINSVCTQLTKEEIAMVRERAAAYIATTS
ncbi:MAG: hypothetical protein LBE35_04090 [Clostridiales bacterium]|jgi:hypothetical protein|nr:hypothetical protein [Clostridiales bacterium]